MQSWLRVQSVVLDEIISLDGPGCNPLDLCSSCSILETKRIYRCIECSYLSIHCVKCIVDQHKVMPLHRLEVCS